VSDPSKSNSPDSRPGGPTDESRGSPSGSVKKVVVFGATGTVGLSAAKHFYDVPGVSVVGVSRRDPQIAGIKHVKLDLSNRSDCNAVLGSGTFRDTTHVVYAALQESIDLVAGWQDPKLMSHNLRLFENALKPLLRAHGSSLLHVSLLQGAKAYGLHVGSSPMPAKESAPRDRHENFYFLQEDALRELSEGAHWSWTVLRPQVVYGESIGRPMNLLPAIGVYASLEKARGRPLCFPGGPQAVQEAVDARLLAQAIDWAGEFIEARNEIFNVTNGDVFSWSDVWPQIGAAFGMEVGEPRPMRLSEVMPPRAAEWAEIVDSYGLDAPRDMAAFVGNSWSYADILFGTLGQRPLPALLSTIKLRQAGFHDCIDTTEMFRYWFARLLEQRQFPSPLLEIGR
jgi:nucleoside-diphosphate-sugar epimerase